MIALEVLAKQEAREERELRVRVALGVKILTSAGYAMIGGTFFKAISDQHAVPPTGYWWAGVGLASIGLAIHFAPYGSDDGK